MTVYICGGAYVYRRRILPCQGACRPQRRRVVVAYGSPYYAPTVTCCACGDSWSEGELSQRPFRRGWRKEAVTRAREQWQQARSGPVRLDEELYPIPDEVA